VKAQLARVSALGRKSSYRQTVENYQRHITITVELMLPCGINFL
jgi:hypothetical protein